MPGLVWRCILSVIVLGGSFSSIAIADEPVLPDVTPTQPAALPDVVLPVEPCPPLKDLTPPALATDLIPPPAESHHWYPGTPGHLAPTVPHEAGFFVSTEALVLRPRRGALDVVIPNATTGLSTTGPIESLNYELSGGFRAELGYRFSRGWDVSAGYTYFRSAAHGVVQAGPGQVLFPTLTRAGLTDQALAAVADANLEYNLYDMAVGRRILVDEHFAVRAMGGFRFANIRQNLDVAYSGLDARSAAVSAPSRFQGFGPMLGGEAVLAGWHGFHLYARGSGGLLTGQANNPLIETNSAGRSVYVATANNVRKVVPVLGMGIGGGWQYRTFTFRAGYEITNWFNLIDQPRFTDDISQGRFVSESADLSLEGLFVQVSLAF